MTPSMAFFYGGFTQAKKVLNTMVISFIIIGIATIVGLIFGFSLASSEGGFFKTLLGIR